MASWIAADAPERVDRLVLASTLPNAGASSIHVVRESLKLVAALCKVGSSAEIALVNSILSDDFRRTQPARVASIERAVREAPTSPRNLLLLAIAAVRHDGTCALRGLRVRTLILAGRRDPIVGRTAERELLHDLPNARLEILENVGHDLSLEAPDETAARVLAFLDERDG